MHTHTHTHSAPWRGQVPAKDARLGASCAVVNRAHPPVCRCCAEMCGARSRLLLGASVPWLSACRPCHSLHLPLVAARRSAFLWHRCARSGRGRGGCPGACPGPTTRSGACRAGLRGLLFDRQLPSLPPQRRGPDDAAARGRMLCGRRGGAPRPPVLPHGPRRCVLRGVAGGPGPVSAEACPGGPGGRRLAPGARARAPGARRRALGATRGPRGVSRWAVLALRIVPRVLHSSASLWGGRGGGV